jgi:hypothetical protein
VELCISESAIGTNHYLIATYAGFVGGRYVYDLNGFFPPVAPPSTDHLLSGAATVSPDENVIHWGYTVLEVNYATQVYEFETDLSLDGNGYIQNLIGTETSASVTITAGPCP